MQQCLHNVKALKTVFPNTVQLRCFIHMKDVCVKGLVDSYDANDFFQWLRLM